MQKNLTLLRVPIALTALVAVAFLQRASFPVKKEPVSAAVKEMFRRDAPSFAAAASRLQVAVRQMDPAGRDSAALLMALQDCRRRYKKIEPWLSFFFPGVAAGINDAPVYEAEDPFMEYQEPRGMQLIEALLTSPAATIKQETVARETDLLAETAATIPTLMYEFKPAEADILQSIRLALIRVTTLGITGYDAPVMKTGLRESLIVCQTISEQLALFPGSEGLLLRAQNMLRILGSGIGFDQFDRAAFLKNAVIPFQAELKIYCRVHGVELPALGLLQRGSTDIFSAGALRPAAVPVSPASEALLALGRKWFNDKSLSRSGIRSCASCHDPAKAFSDGLALSIGLNPHRPLQRNTPSLLYSSYQYRQFWDGRSDGLESQINAVLHDSLEMDIDTVALAKRWKQIPDYRDRITAAFPGPARLFPSQMIGVAISAYLNTLGKFNAPFDRYLRGDSLAITGSAKKGFNLFMGKARCGSCHFAPVFNGTLPPDFTRTEFEVLGTTRDADFRHPVLSPDAGRYGAYPLPFNRYSFKTATVRNAALTAPYMHNGAFRTLEQVMTFYNNGGGAEMGLKLPGQTLSRDSLHLDKSEISDIIAFIYALNDKSEGLKQ